MDCAVVGRCETTEPVLDEKVEPHSAPVSLPIAVDFRLLTILVSKLIPPLIFGTLVPLVGEMLCVTTDGKADQFFDTDFSAPTDPKLPSSLGVAEVIP